MVKVLFFQKNQFGIGVWCGKPWKMGQKWKKVDFYSECGVTFIHFILV